tara:strand:- start:255 stop:1061 length:807 start_codon:yes stop_codon:yes gene_type:complete
MENKNKILDEIRKDYNGDLVKRIIQKKHLIKGSNKIFYFFNNPDGLQNDPFNNIKVFDVPINSYKCSLNEKGRKKYGKMEDLNFVNKSKVGTKYGYIYLPKIRKSKYMKSIFEFDGNNIEEIVMNNIKSLCDDDILEWNKKSKYTVLEYNEGDFFLEHRDNKINKKHFGTLLIFPPAIDYFEHSGGDLILENGVWDLVIPSSNNKNWKFVVFNTDIKHACLKISKGRRLILKTELFKKNKVNHDTISYPVCADGGIIEPEPEPLECCD